MGLLLRPVDDPFRFTGVEPSRGDYGIPWQNYIGWLIVSGVITLGISLKCLPAGLLVVLYGLIWLLKFNSLLVFWGCQCRSVWILPNGWESALGRGSNQIIDKGA